MSDPTTLMKQYVEKNKQQINDDSLEFNDGEYGATSPVKPPPVQSAFVKPVITVKEPNGALADEDEQLEQAEREEDAQKVRDQAYIKSLNLQKSVKVFPLLCKSLMLNLIREKQSAVPITKMLLLTLLN